MTNPRIQPWSAWQTPSVDGTVLALQFGAFATCGVMAAIAQGRFFRALERREPGGSAPDAELLDAIGLWSSKLVQIIATGTRARLAALARSWQYPEVERLRRWAVAWITVTLFGWLIARPGG
jgi:hypothetical protein